MDDQMNHLKQLSPAELAVLWLANSTNGEKKDSPVVLASNSTLTLMIVLANGSIKHGHPRLLAKY
jgi:hypothetical protein